MIFLRARVYLPARLGARAQMSALLLARLGARAQMGLRLLARLGARAQMGWGKLSCAALLMRCP